MPWSGLGRSVLGSERPSSSPCPEEYALAGEVRVAFSVERRRARWHDACVRFMPLVNATPFAVFSAPVLDRAGREVVLVIVKATFEVAAPDRVALADEQLPVRVADVPRDESNPRSSARYPSDLCTEKLGSDLVVLGDAVARQPTTFVDVEIRARATTVPMRVTGEREYFRGILHVGVSAAVPFETMPIEYERAYGGMLDDLSDVEHRNPAGVGFARSPADLVGTPAPQIEHPGTPYRTAKDRHPPIGCGALLPHWSPRREHAGTFDDAWKATRMPLMPRDFDVRHNNVAHPSLMFDPPLSAGDVVSILGMTHDAFQLSVPSLRLVLHGRYDERTETVRPDIDTVLVEPAPGRFELTARHAFPIGRGRNVLRELRVDIDE